MSKKEKEDKLSFIDILTLGCLGVLFIVYLIFGDENEGEDK